MPFGHAPGSCGSLPIPRGGPGAESGAPIFAGFWIRVCAYVLDSLILSVLVWMVVTVAVTGYTFGASGVLSVDDLSATSRAPLSSMAGMDVLAKLIYFTFFLARSGQTPGKRLFGLRVVATGGGRLTHGQALVRTLGYYINMFTLGIGFLWVAVDRRKQGLHDKIAGTLELRVPPE